MNLVKHYYSFWCYQVKLGAPEFRSDLRQQQETMYNLYLHNVLHICSKYLWLFYSKRVQQSCITQFFLSTFQGFEFFCRHLLMQMHQRFFPNIRKFQLATLKFYCVIWLIFKRVKKIICLFLFCFAPELFRFRIVKYAGHLIKRPKRFPS